MTELDNIKCDIIFYRQQNNSRNFQKMTQVRNLINKSIDMFEMLKKILIEIDWVSNTIDQRLINHKVNWGLLIWTRNMCLSKDSIHSPTHEQIDILVVDKIDNLVECIKVRKRHLRRLALN